MSELYFIVDQEPGEQLVYSNRELLQESKKLQFSMEAGINGSKIPKIHMK